MSSEFIFKFISMLWCLQKPIQYCLEQSTGKTLISHQSGVTSLFGTEKMSLKENSWDLQSYYGARLHNSMMCTVNCCNSRHLLRLLAQASYPIFPRFDSACASAHLDILSSFTLPPPFPFLLPLLPLPECWRGCGRCCRPTEQIVLLQRKQEQLGVATEAQRSQMACWRTQLGLARIKFVSYSTLHVCFQNKP